MNKPKQTKRPKCLYCGKRIRNFTKTIDWKKRRYHKKCWKEKMDWEIAVYDC